MSNVHGVVLSGSKPKNNVPGELLELVEPVVAIKASRLCLSIVLGLIISGDVRAETYQWVDKGGNTVYSDSPPIAGDYKTLKDPPIHDDAPARQRLEAQQRSFDERRAQRVKTGEQARTHEKELAMRKRNCDLAKDKLARLTGIPRVYSVDESGERVRIDEDERSARTREAEKQVREYCSD